MMLKKLSILLVVALLALTFAACSSTKTVTQTKTVTSTITQLPPTSASPVVTITVAAPPATTTTGLQPAGDLANLGASKYDANCTFTYCHANVGDSSANNSPASGAPFAVNFSKSALTYFGTASDMFVFMKSFMHHPDTASFLTDQDFLQIEAFILTQNGTLTAAQQFGLGNLSTIALP